MSHLTPVMHFILPLLWLLLECSTHGFVGKQALHWTYQPISSPRLTTATFAKRSSSAPSSSLFSPILDLAVQWGGSPNNAKGQNGGHKIIESMLVLSDKKRQSHFKKTMGEQFPWIPPGVLDVCMDALADSFANVAPADLQRALKPGGLDKMRPKIEGKVVANLQEQAMVQNLPLSKDDKNKMLTYLVTLSLDYLLKDAQAALAAPYMKLETLEREKREIQKYMTFWQLTWYRIRFFPLPMLSWSLLVSWSLYLTFQLCQNAVWASTISGIVVKCYSTVKVAMIKLLKVAASILPDQKKRAWRR